MKKAPSVPDEARDLQASEKNLAGPQPSFHGARISLDWFPASMVPPAPKRRKTSLLSARAVTGPEVAGTSGAVNQFGYLKGVPNSVRTSSKLAFTPANRLLLEQLGDTMGRPGRDTSADGPIPAGYTYFGQFVDHDITFEVASSLDSSANVVSLPNMRTPALDLDSVYGRGPGLDPFLYVFPGGGLPPTAIKMALGSNRNFGTGGPGGPAGFGGMAVQTDFDLPRMTNFLNPAASSNRAIIGDPRNDENLLVSQFHLAMLRFHNKTIDKLVADGFAGDLFSEAKRLVTHHYQWAVLHDFLKRLCGATAVTNAIGSVTESIGASFRMPVEFSAAAYRLGHSMIRENYWVNFNFINASLGEVFQFASNPQLPVFSNWVVDWNAFFDTGISVPVNNKARKIDTVLTNGLANLPGFSGLMAVLAKRNLLRGLAFGLPSGQKLAAHFGLSVLSNAQLVAGLPADEAAFFAPGSPLRDRTPLWYYILREAAVRENGNQLGPLGAKIVAETFVRILRRDANSILNRAFSPSLPSAVAGQFELADLIKFSGVNLPA